MKVNVQCCFYSQLRDLVSSEYIGVHVGLCRFLESGPQNINRYSVAYITRGTVQSHYKHIIGEQAFPQSAPHTKESRAFPHQLREGICSILNMRIVITVVFALLVGRKKQMINITDCN